MSRLRLGGDVGLGCDENSKKEVVFGRPFFVLTMVNMEYLNSVVW